MTLTDWLWCYCWAPLRYDIPKLIRVYLLGQAKQVRAEEMAIVTAALEAMRVFRQEYEDQIAE
jgi:hypothetical protein